MLNFGGVTQEAIHPQKLTLEDVSPVNMTISHCHVTSSLLEGNGSTEVPPIPRTPEHLGDDRHCLDGFYYRSCGNCLFLLEAYGSIIYFIQTYSFPFPWSITAICPFLLTGITKDTQFRDIQDVNVW